MNRNNNFPKRSIRHIAIDFSKNPWKIPVTLLCLLVTGLVIATVIIGSFDNIIWGKFPFAIPRLLALPALLAERVFLVMIVLLVAYFSMPLIALPFKAGHYQKRLMEAGFVTPLHRQPPLLVTRYPIKNDVAEIFEFEVNGLPIQKWEDKKPNLAQALRVSIFNIEEKHGNNQRILLYTSKLGKTSPKNHTWDDRYLFDGNTLVLGVDMAGKNVTVNLAKIPHMLLGGSSGSGKSVLLKLMLMQCIKKEYVVLVGDLKGGVDFPNVWHDKCRILLDEGAISQQLSSLVEELERRKQQLAAAGCANLDEFNARTGHDLPRIIFACDEIGELLDKTGRDKAAKERIAVIESYLSTIARQARAFGIYLFLATQRPDATILPGQIKNNIDFRACGRADKILSQIILDNTDAAEKIPKDAQGRFLTNDGVLFQAFWFDENTAFEKGADKYAKGTAQVS